MYKKCTDIIEDENLSSKYIVNIFIKLSCINSFVMF